MDQLIEKLSKYWFVISILFTVLSSIATGGWYLKGKIDALTDVVGDTKQWVSDHDDSINALHDDILKLKEDERLREAGLLK